MMPAARALFAAYLLGTFLYALLAHDPFTYTQVLKFDLLPGLNPFAKLHAYLAMPAFVLGALSIWPAFKHPRARRQAFIYVVAAASGAVALLSRPLLPGLESDRRSLVVAFLALFPLLWMSAVDLSMDWHLAAPDQAPSDPARSSVLASSLTGALVFIAFAALALVRGEKPSMLLGYEVALHALVALAIAAVLLLITAPISSPRLQLWLGTAAISAVLGFASRKGLAAIAFPPKTAPLVAAALGITLGVSLLGVAVRAREQGAADIPLQSLFRPISLPRRLPLAIRAGVPLIACALASWLSAGYDWNFLVQSTCALCAWIFTLAALVTAPRPASPPPASWFAILTAGAFLAATSARSIAANPALPSLLPAALAYDASLRTLALATGTAPATGGAFFELLARHTNLPSATSIAPLDVQLSKPPLQATPGRHPDIFIIVIDSLRRDYLPPYAAEAETFAPRVAAFARDAVVFRNAFTRYGATGLSEPSIWVGGMMPHKQYITPFAPMNALAKLVAAEDYAQFVSIDAILDVVVPRTPSLTPLDLAVPNKDYALCRTLAELQEKLGALGRGKPAFAYTQPQDLHVSRIAREGPMVPPGATFPAGFHPPVAARLQKLDVCFGDFIAELDRSGRGDDAIVVLTADHGDAMGEEGRWGHAYTIYPEIVRIPLLMRLPKAWRGRAHCKLDELAFSADLTPTLYALLGHAVEEKTPFGAPLCALDGEPPPRHAGPQLVASSYGPVYGLVEQGGARLYIADAVNYSEEAFALGEGAPQRLNLTDAEKTEGERLIVEKLKQLEETYGMKWE